jgi:predicted nucleotidyltransferase
MLGLTNVERVALDEYQARLTSEFPQQIVRLVLFGSKARGDAGPESDLDVLVVVHGNGGDALGFYPLGLTDPVWREIVGLSFDLLMKYQVDISPTVMSEGEFKRNVPLADRAMKEGIEL